MPGRDKPARCAAAMSISWKAIAGDTAWVMRCSENGYNFKPKRATRLAQTRRLALLAPRMRKPRPKYLNLVKIRLPLPGIKSIMHRVSGAALFLLIPFLLYVLQMSLASERG